MNRPVTNNMPTLKRKSPRKSLGKRPTYYGTREEQDSPHTTSQKALKPPSKFKHKIGYKELRKKSPVLARKRSTKTSSKSSYEEEESESDNENKGLTIDISKKRPSKTMVSTRSERKQGDGTTDDNDDDMDGVEQGNNSPELSVTKFRKEYLQQRRRQ